MPAKEGMQFLVDIGLLDVILPFLLVFTLTYGVLQTTRVFGTEDGEPKKHLNAMTAFVFGFLAVAATNVLNVLNVMLTHLVVLLIAGLLFAMIVGFTGVETSSKSKALIGLMTVLFVLFVLHGLAQAGVIRADIFAGSFVPGILAFLALGVVIYYVTRGPPAKAEAKKAEPTPGKKPSERPLAPKPTEPQLVKEKEITPEGTQFL